MAKHPVRSLPVNSTIPIEVQRRFDTLVGWAQQDHERLSSVESNHPAVQKSAAVQQSNLVQMLTATSAQVVTPAPKRHDSPGRAGQIATDPSGNLYFCYGPNQWARLGSGGYSNTFT